MSSLLDGALRAYGTFVFRYRDYLVPAALLLIVLFTHPLPWRGDARADAVLDALGICIALAGQSMRVLVIGLAYIQRGGKNKRIAGDELVTDGMFAHCRHPLYLGNFLLLLGLLMVWNSPAAYLLGLSAVGLSLFAMAYAEESFLRRKFGAPYAAYCRQVNAFVPNPRGLRSTLARFQFDWRRVIRKEYGTTFSWTTTAVLLVVLEHAVWSNGADLPGAAIAGVSVWLCLAVLWGTARWLKKSGRLSSNA